MLNYQLKEIGLKNTSLDVELNNKEVKVLNFKKELQVAKEYLTLLDT